jgi:glutamyl-tRNA synthetase
MAGSLNLIGPDESADLWQLLERFHPARLPRQPWVVGPELSTPR